MNRRMYLLENIRLYEVTISLDVNIIDNCELITNPFEEENTLLCK